MGLELILNMAGSLALFLYGMKLMGDGLEKAAGNYLDEAITRYMVSASQLDLPKRDAERLGKLFHVVNDLERIGDHAENMAEFAQQRVEQNVAFSDESLGEMQEMLDLVLDLCDTALTALHTGDKRLMPQILVLEEDVDELERRLQQSHVERLRRGECTPESGMMFTDMLSNLERVGDHATNVGYLGC